ncbi:hypothetical protein D3C76_337490 [compost metagenome]
MDIHRAHWGASGKVLSLNQLFSEIRCLRIEDFESYRRLDKLQLLEMSVATVKGSQPKSLGWNTPSYGHAR